MSVMLPQEILNVTDRVQSVSSLAVSPCAQQLLTCNKWVLLRLSRSAAHSFRATRACIAVQCTGGIAQSVGVESPRLYPRQCRAGRLGLQWNCCVVLLPIGHQA
jgi:hypothetical protein